MDKYNKINKAGLLSYMQPWRKQSENMQGRLEVARLICYPTIQKNICNLYTDTCIFPE